MNVRSITFVLVHKHAKEPCDCNLLFAVAENEDRLWLDIVESVKTNPNFSNDVELLYVLERKVPIEELIKKINEKFVYYDAYGVTLFERDNNKQWYR